MHDIESTWELFSQVGIIMRVSMPDIESTWELFSQLGIL